MPVISIPLGAPTDILQNIIYALPNRACLILSTVALEVGQKDTGAWVAAPTSTSGMQTAGSFIRCTTAGATVTAKPLG